MNKHVFTSQTMRLYVIVPLMAILALPVHCEVVRHGFTVQVLGVKVGEFSMASEMNDDSFGVAAGFGTTGLASAFAERSVQLTSTGFRRGNRFVPHRYTEHMDTRGEISRGEMAWRDGFPYWSGESNGEGRTVPRSALKGAIDPMTALFLLLRDQERDRLCAVDMRVFDGKRLSEVILSKREETNDSVVCSGQLRRIEGYSAKEMRTPEFPVTLTYRPYGGQMRSQRMQVTTVYGQVSAIRRLD